MVQRHPVVNTRSLAPFFAWGVSYLASCHLSCEMWTQGEGICPRVPPLPCVAQVLLVACSYAPVLGWQQGHCIASKQPRSWFSDQSPGLGSQSLANMNRIKILIPLVEVSGKTLSLSVMGQPRVTHSWLSREALRSLSKQEFARSKLLCPY